MSRIRVGARPWSAALCFGAMGLWSLTAAQAAGDPKTPFQVFTDPGATHEILEINVQSTSVGDIVAKRSTVIAGQSVESFAVYRFDCAKGAYQVMGFGETLEQAKAKRPKGAPDPKSEKIAPGAISEAIWERVCQE